jgi:hypothetical protein
MLKEYNQIIYDDDNDNKLNIHSSNIVKDLNSI